MKIVVLLKETPDTYGDRTLNLETGLAQRDADDNALDEISGRALEVALAHRDASKDAEIVVVSMAPASAQATIRKGLAMGADQAVQIVDDALSGADLGLSAQVLAAAIAQVGPDLVICGNQSTDGNAGALPAMLAELLDMPDLTGLNSVEIADGAVSGQKALDGGFAQVSAELPAVISITERLPDARLANFKGIMAAKKKPYETKTLADLGVDADDVSVPRSIMIAISEKPPRAAGTKIVDEGDAGTQLAQFLIENRLA